MFLSRGMPYTPITSGAIRHRIRLYADRAGVSAKVLGSHTRLSLDETSIYKIIYRELLMDPVSPQGLQSGLSVALNIVQHLPVFACLPFDGLSGPDLLLNQIGDISG